MHNNTACHIKERFLAHCKLNPSCIALKKQEWTVENINILWLSMTDFQLTLFYATLQRTNHCIRATMIGGPYYTQARANARYAFSTNRRVDLLVLSSQLCYSSKFLLHSLNLLASSYLTMIKGHFSYSITLTAWSILTSVRISMSMFLLYQVLLQAVLMYAHNKSQINDYIDFCSCPSMAKGLCMHCNGHSPFMVWPLSILKQLPKPFMPHNNDIDG